jgi:hypothetical protein
MIDSSCIMFSSCAWYEYLIIWAVSYGFLLYIIGSAIFTFMIILSIIKS